MGFFFVGRGFFFGGTCRGSAAKEDVVSNGVLLLRHFLYLSVALSTALPHTIHRQGKKDSDEKVKVLLEMGSEWKQ